MRPLLLLSVLTVLGDARNIAPAHHGRAEPSSPAVAATARDSFARVSPDHVFYANYAKHISAVTVEEKLAAFGLHLNIPKKPSKPPTRRLWTAPARRRADGTPTSTSSEQPPTLVQRAPVIPTALPTKVAEVTVGPDSCVQCANLDTLGPATIGIFTPTYFKNNMLAGPETLKDRCIFYSAVFFKADYDTWNTYWTLQGQLGQLFDYTYKQALSHRATEYACGNNRGLYSIWMLWPGVAPGGENPNGVPNDFSPNFWEVYVPGSWLYQISQNNQQGTYFQTMSTTMALWCGGITRVMSIDPTNLKKYTGTIWIEQEYKTLRERNNGAAGGSPYRPTSLIAILATDTTQQYLINWDDDLTVNRQLASTDPLYINLVVPKQGLAKRDACDSNVVYEDATKGIVGIGNGDWFG